MSSNDTDAIRTEQRTKGGATAGGPKSYAAVALLTFAALFGTGILVSPFLEPQLAAAFLPQLRSVLAFDFGLEERKQNPIVVCDLSPIIEAPFGNRADLVSTANWRRLFRELREVDPRPVALGFAFDFSPELGASATSGPPVALPGRPSGIGPSQADLSISFVQPADHLAFLQEAATYQRETGVPVYVGLGERALAYPESEWLPNGYVQMGASIHLLRNMAAQPVELWTRPAGPRLQSIGQALAGAWLRANHGKKPSSVFVIPITDPQTGARTHSVFVDYSPLRARRAITARVAGAGEPLLLGDAARRRIQGKLALFGPATEVSGSGHFAAGDDNAITSGRVLSNVYAHACEAYTLIVAPAKTLPASTSFLIQLGFAAIGLAVVASFRKKLRGHSRASVLKRHGEVCWYAGLRTIVFLLPLCAWFVLAAFFHTVWLGFLAPWVYLLFEPAVSPLIQAVVLRGHRTET